MANMIVSGAGTSVANGTYVETGTYQSHPQYIKSDGNLIRWMVANYAIGASNLYCDIDYGPQGTVYYTSSACVTPDLSTFWNKAQSGVLPAPTVTLEQSGTTHEGEVALSSLSYLRTKKA